MASIKGATLAKYIDRKLVTETVQSDVGESIARQVFYTLNILDEIYDRDESTKKISRKLMNVIGENFSQYIDARAATEPKRLHHVYEFNGVGNRSDRLFKFKVTTQRFNARGTVNFLKAKIPNNDGYLFQDKAMVFERGNAVQVFPINGDRLVFPRRNKDGKPIILNGEQQFVYAKKTVIKNPGGKLTSGEMDRRIKAYWQSGMAGKIIKDTNLLNQLLREARGPAPKKANSKTTKAAAKSKGQAAVKRRTK